LSTAQQTEANRSLITSNESRISVLEHQFVAFRAQKDLEAAIQAEVNCWQENIANEAFFVISGLPAPQAKLSGG
jgi:hypothetical protein